MVTDPSPQVLIAAHFSVSPSCLEPAAGGTAPAFVLSSGEKRFFIKMLECCQAARVEADGLAAIAASPFRVPAVEDVVALGGGAALVLEWLPLTPLRPGHMTALVHALKTLHELGTGQAYGWHCDNRIGAALQLNRRSDDWAAFFASQRLQPQLARARGLPAALRGKLHSVLDRCAEFLPSSPTPALLHGDLWRGNLAWCIDRPALFDPAVYVGDADVDLAMLQLFGEPLPGLSAACGAPGNTGMHWPVRQRIYDLYHLLNHYNLFGTSWLPALQSCCDAVAGYGEDI